MTNAALEAAIDEAIELKNEIADRESALALVLKPKRERLEFLKALIGGAAAERPEVANETAGGGLSWNFPSFTRDGHVRVTQPSAKLISVIEDETLIAKLQALCGRSFRSLFVVSYKRAGDTKKWRELVLRTLAKKQNAEKVIALCEIASTPTVTIS